MKILDTVFSISLQVIAFVLIIKYFFFPEKEYRFYRVVLNSRVLYIKTSKKLSLDIYKTLSLKGSCIIDELEIEKINDEDEIIKLL